MINKTGCDGIMIGRGALGEPWIFEEIAAGLDGREYVHPTLEQRLDVCLAHVRAMRDKRGERVGAAEIKKHAALYIKGVRGAATARDSIMKAATIQEIEDLISAIRNSCGGEA